MKVLVIGGFHKSSVAGIRALARAGHEVHAVIERRVGQTRGSLLFLSKYIRKYFVVPHAEENERGFTSRLLEIVSGEKYDAILPWTHYSTIPICRNRDQFARYTGLAVPDLSTFLDVHDKESLHRRLRNNGFLVPRFYTYETLEDLCKQDIQYPVVVKARRYSGVEKGTRYAGNAKQLEQAFRDVEGYQPKQPGLDEFTRPFVQEYVPGKVHDASCICDHGHVRAAVTQFRRDTYPINGGVMSTGISTDEPELMAYARNVFASLNWHGPGQVETIKDERDGRHKLLEINPRFWGAVDLGIKAGVNFPVLAAELAAHGECRECLSYQVGFVYKKVFPEELFAIYQDRGHRGPRLRELGQILTGKIACEVDFRDIKPDLLDAIQTLRTFLFDRSRIYAPPFAPHDSETGQRID